MRCISSKRRTRVRSIGKSVGTTGSTRLDYLKIRRQQRAMLDSVIRDEVTQQDQPALGDIGSGSSLTQRRHTYFATLYEHRRKDGVTFQFLGNWYVKRNEMMTARNFELKVEPSTRAIVTVKALRIPYQGKFVNSGRVGSW